MSVSLSHFEYNELKNLFNLPIPYINVSMIQQLMIKATHQKIAKQNRMCFY